MLNKPIFIAASTFLLSVSAAAMAQSLPPHRSVTVSSGSVKTEETREGVDQPEFIPSRQNYQTPSTSAVDFSDYDHLDPKNLIADKALRQAVAFFKENKNKIRNTRYLTIIDFTKHSSKKRMYVVDMVSGAVASYYVSHGKGSDADADGWADRFSNREGSKASSLGFYSTGAKYSGSHGVSMYLHGLQSSNSNAYERAIVMHGADYVKPGSVGRSWGCPAVETRLIADLVSRLKNGSLLYIYARP